MVYDYSFFDKYMTILIPIIMSFYSWALWYISLRNGDLGHVWMSKKSSNVLDGFLIWDNIGPKHPWKNIYMISISKIPWKKEPTNFICLRKINTSPPWARRGLSGWGKGEIAFPHPRQGTCPPDCCPSPLAKQATEVVVESSPKGGQSLATLDVAHL